MLNKFKAAEKSLKKSIKSKTGRKGLKMYKEVKANVLKPSLAKKTIGGFSRGIQKERQLIADKKYQQAVQEWRASMLHLALEMVDTIEFAMKKFGHTADEAKAYSDRALAKVLVIKERLTSGKYDSMINDAPFAIETFAAEIIAASGMGLFEQKFFNSCVNGAAEEEDFEEDLDDEFEEDFWDLDEEPQENFEGPVEDYREVVVVDEPKVEIIEDDEYKNTVRQRRVTYLVNLRISTAPAIDNCDDAMKILAELDEEVSKINSGEYDGMSDNDFYKHINTDIMEKVTEAYFSRSSKDLENETTEEASVEVADDIVEPETIGETVEDGQDEVEVVVEVVEETSEEPETAAEAVEAAVKEVLEMDVDDESNGRYPAKKKGRKPANASEK